MIPISQVCGNKKQMYTVHLGECLKYGNGSKMIAINYEEDLVPLKQCPNHWPCGHTHTFLII